MKHNVMILSAGLGLRMRPITDSLPKPLVKVAGRTMLDRAFDHLKYINVNQVIVNSHYLADQVHAHVEDRAIISHEPILLETGGGVQNALPLLGQDPFFVLNGDCVWTGSQSLKEMEEIWDETKMDVLLLVIPHEKANGYEGLGDFFLSPSNHLSRRGDAPEAPYVFTGVQILNPSLFEGEPIGPYSLNNIYNKAMSKGRLIGHVHEGEWFHISTPEDLKKYEPIIVKLESS
jgi:MurNAc alpha-1-phosphate uridylyltransferase